MTSEKAKPVPSQDHPIISESVYIAPTAVVLGTVFLDDEVNIWPHATLRGDMAGIKIGKGTNIQDNAVLHVDLDFELTVGSDVTIGHCAIVHGCTVGDNTIIGMGAIVLNGAHVGKNCIVGAGALVTQNKVIPDGSLVFGNPARIQRSLTPQEIADNIANAAHYRELAHRDLPRASQSAYVSTQ